MPAVNRGIPMPDDVVMCPCASCQDPNTPDGDRVAVFRDQSVSTRFAGEVRGNLFYPADVWREFHPEYRSGQGDSPWATYAQAAMTSAELATALSNMSAALSGVVGNPNEEGETDMPRGTGRVVRMNIPHTPTTRRELFDNMRVVNNLMQELDEEVWTAALERLREAVEGGIPIDVTEGDYGYNSYMEAQVGSRWMEVTAIDLDSAQEYVKVASNSTLRLAVDETTWRAYIRPISDLEHAAWVSYMGDPEAVGTPVDYTGPTKTLRPSGLRDIMLAYSEFRRRDRKKMIRLEMKKRMADSKPSSPPPVWDTTRVAKFDKFFRALRKNLVVERDSLKQLPILPHKTLSSRKWGIEIEAVHIDDVKTPEYWQLKRDGSLRGLHVSSLPSRSRGHSQTCRVLTEEGASEDRCSCQFYLEDYGRETRTGEWNSPILRSYHSRGLKYLTDQIEFRDTNSTAGVHVHVEAGDLNAEQAIKLSIMYSALEPLFEREYHRAERSYCQSVDTAEMINRFNAMRNSGAKAEGRSLRVGTGRYWTVNLAALQSHGTVEFRAMGPVYNYEHLIRWAYLCRELVNLAKVDVPQREWTSVRTMRDMVVLLSRYGKETPAPDGVVPGPAEDIVAKIVEGLGTENRRVPHSSRLRSGDSRSPLVVFEDYTGTDRFVPENPLEEELNRLARPRR